MKKSLLIVLLVLCFALIMVGGCSSQKPSPSPKPEPNPDPKPEPEPEPEPLWNFDEEELVVNFLEKTYDEFIAEYGEPVFELELEGYFWYNFFVYFNEEEVSYRFSIWDEDVKMFQVVVQKTSLEELLSLHGEEEEYSEVNGETPKFCTYSYGYRWRAIWGQVERLFKVTFHVDYQDKVKGIEVELLP